MSAAKRKQIPEQPELPIENGGTTKDDAAQSKPVEKSNGENHVLAEEVAMVEHVPFAPRKMDLALHRRVNTNFLE